MNIKRSIFQFLGKKEVNYLAIADIHATVLSIFLGGISAYALYFYNTVDQMEIQAFQEADKINRVSLSCIRKFKDYAVSDTESRKQLVIRLEGFIRRDHRELPKNLVDQGRELTSMMSVLLEHYPFRPMGGESLLFHNIDKLRQWISDVEYIANQLNHALYMHRSLMYEAMVVKDDIIDSCYLPLGTTLSHERTLPTGEKETITRELTKEEIEATNRLCCDKITVANGFINYLIQARDIARSTNIKLAEIQSYKNRHINKDTIIYGYIASFVAFMCGVVCPIIGLNRLVIILLPLIVYFMVLIVLFIEILKI